MAKQQETLDFANNVIKNATPDECVIWPYVCTGVNGGNRPHFRGGDMRDTRVAVYVCRQFYGPAPEGKPFALHKCPGKHNPKCINPYHLAWGSHVENMKDKAEQDPKREVLSDLELAQIILQASKGLKVKQIAKNFNLNRESVSKYIRGKQTFLTRKIA